MGLEILAVIAQLCQFSVAMDGRQYGVSMSSQRISSDCQIKMIKCIDVTSKTRGPRADLGVIVKDCVLDGRTK